MPFVTYEHAMETLDDWAADHPLEALREYAEYLPDYRLDACATAEPAAALVHAFGLLTDERRAWCLEQARGTDLNRFVPDRLEHERRLVLRRRLEGVS
jgi:hypothetical protein